MLAAKASFEADLIQESSPKNILRVYRYINSITRHDTIPPTVSLDSHIATSDIEKANLFNTFFHSVFTHSSYNLPPLEMLPMPPSTISDITISESDVYDAMTSLNPTKAMGIDGIGPKLLKHCALALYQSLHHLFTLSLVQHYLPQECFNVAKCALLRFSSGCPPVVFNYTINDNLISAQETHRDLGIIRSSDLSWREHMKSILCRAYKTLNLV